MGISSLLFSLQIYIKYILSYLPLSYNSYLYLYYLIYLYPYIIYFILSTYYIIYFTLIILILSNLLNQIK